MTVGPFTIETEPGPIFIFHFPSEYTTEELQAALQAMTQLLQKTDTDFALLSIAHVSHSSAINRSLLADFMSDNEHLLAAHCVCWGVIMESLVQRGALTAIFWMKSPQWPMKTFSKRDEAMRWINTQMTQAQAQTA